MTEDRGRIHFYSCTFRAAVKSTDFTKVHHAALFGSWAVPQHWHLVTESRSTRQHANIAKGRSEFTLVSLRAGAARQVSNKLKRLTEFRSSRRSLRCPTPPAEADREQDSEKSLDAIFSCVQMAYMFTSQPSPHRKGTPKPNTCGQCPPN